MSDYKVQDEVTDKYSLRGRVFHRLREDILVGKYKENESLKETIISNELGVSRTPVREAIRQLELEGLVNIIPNKGAIVTGINEKDIKDIYAIRSLLEGLCARWAVDHFTEKKIEQIEEIIYLSEFHIRKGHFEHVYELDNKFHEALYDASNSKTLKHLLSDFHYYVQKVRKESLSTNKRALKSIEEHKAILEAIKNKDGDKAEYLANLHIKNTSKNVIDNYLDQ
ncbi:GntR family transcriptional regulator [Natranaerovirga hydrolytica]|uniref:GntR family transcriptional regulator n=1 Tax=Natranaerovirga hydrolytica TaxID=680378 RepID=A0A4V2Q0D8_9FIRM|nr:GntR family transcriptional regulator [Natranaerovirga hydrolytica]TCK92871.1 GntR family transcriptional regulator [Natranaerovirga hydrolytica]